MSDNYRKDVSEYSQWCDPKLKGPKQRVYRPHSMRQVDPSAELNRLRSKLIEIEEEASFVDCTCPFICLKCAIIGIVK